MTTVDNHGTFSVSLRSALVAFLALGAGTLAGCVATTGPDENVWEEDTSSRSDAIINGVDVTAKYPEAVTIDAGTLQLCSGVLIAPMVVLTAGRCVDTYTTWTVKAGNESRTTTSSATFDWTSGNAKNPAQHDVALLFLSQPIWLHSYPQIAQTEVPTYTTVTNVGRNHNGVTGTLWGTAVYDLNRGSIIKAQPPYSGGFVFDYSAANVLEPGDSGGPVFLGDIGATHQIVAVNSASGIFYGYNYELLARVDLLHSWITQQVAAHPPPVPTNAQISCVFNWAELAYPGLFSPPAPGVMSSAPPYTYRYYAGTNSYLGAAWADGNSPSQGALSPNVNYPIKHIYYLAPGGAPEDYGTVGYWMKQANCF